MKWFSRALFPALMLMPQLAFAQTLALGTVTVTSPSVTCPPNSAKGAKCLTVSVTCPGTDTISATIGVARPKAPIGTILMHGGLGGTAMLTNKFANAYLSKKFQTVQIAWATDWEDTGADQPGSILVAACRPATVFKWAYSTYHSGGKATPYCLQGHSAGSGAVAYSLDHYGLKSLVDAAMLSAGPPFGDIDVGCTEATSLDVCQGFPGVTNYAPDGVIDTWEHTTTCQESPSAADQAVWQASSVDAPVADYDYPQTVLSSFQCPDFNEAPALGTYFFNNVTSPISTIQCDGGCPSEIYWYTNANFNNMVNQMVTDCVARH